MSAVRAAWAVPAALALLLAAGAAADWLQPPPDLREAQLALREAIRDTVAQPRSPAVLDTLGVALLRLGRMDEAAGVFGRVLALAPGDDGAEAALGKIALFRDDLQRADSLLSRAAKTNHDAAVDLFAAKLRRSEYAAAADLADEAAQPGRAQLLRLLAEQKDVCAVGSGPDHVSLMFAKSWPVPLLRVKLNGQSVLMALDTGAGDLLLDAAAARRCKVAVYPNEWPTFWSGTHVAVKSALVQRLDLGAMHVERVPAGVLNLHRWSLELNPQAEPVAGVIGLDALRLFVPTIDYRNLRLELRRLGRARTPVAGERRVPFEIWGESELTVYGSLNGGRRMAMVVQSGVPGCGVGAPQDVFDEIGVKPGMVARMVKGAGSWLQGRPWAAVVVPTVTVGPVAHDKVPGWSGALDPVEVWRHGVRRDALLSNDFFRGERVTIDWESRDLVFEGN